MGAMERETYSLAQKQKRNLLFFFGSLGKKVNMAQFFLGGNSLKCQESLNSPTESYSMILNLS